MITFSYICFPVDTVRLTNRVNGETYVTEGNLTFYSTPGIYAGRGSTGWNTTSNNVYPIFDPLLGVDRSTVQNPNNKQITNDYNGPRPENLRLQPEKLPNTPPRIVPEMPNLQSRTVLKKPQMESSILSAR